jgi:hypothetical protein
MAFAEAATRNDSIQYCQARQQKSQQTGLLLI